VEIRVGEREEYRTTNERGEIMKTERIEKELNEFVQQGGCISEILGIVAQMSRDIAGHLGELANINPDGADAADVEEIKLYQYAATELDDTKAVLEIVEGEVSVVSIYTDKNGERQIDVDKYPTRALSPTEGEEDK